MPTDSRDTVSQLWEEADGQFEYLGRLQEELGHSVPAVRTHTNGPHPVTIVGVVHSGKYSMQVEEAVIKAKQPTYIGVEEDRVRTHVHEWLGLHPAGRDTKVAFNTAKHTGSKVRGIDLSLEAKDLHRLLTQREFSAVRWMNHLANLLIILVFALMVTNLWFGEYLTAGFNLVILGLIYLLDRKKTQVRPPHRPVHLFDIGFLAMAEYTPDESYQKETNGWREDHMARRIDALRQNGSVVAVVGYAHLNGLTDRLDMDDDAWEIEPIDQYIDSKL